MESEYGTSQKQLQQFRTANEKWNDPVYYYRVRMDFQHNETVRTRQNTCYPGNRRHQAREDAWDRDWLWFLHLIG